MDLDVEALRTSYDLVVRSNPNFAATFFAVLFARRPQTKLLFAGISPRARQLGLAYGLRSVLEHLEDEDWLDDVLHRMGADHLAQGATRETYAWCAEVLIVVFMEASGVAWTPRVARAWSEAFPEVIAKMLEGAAEADTLVDHLVAEPTPVSVQ